MIHGVMQQMLPGTGHLLKSRAFETRVEGCTLASLDGDTSREMDIPEGGIVHIDDAVLEKGPGSENPEMIGYLAEEYDPTRTHSFTMVNSRLVNDQGKVSLLPQRPLRASLVIVETLALCIVTTDCCARHDQ
jgi:hypothetical protein